MSMFMERKYLDFLSCFPTWNKSLWFVDTSWYYIFCLVSRDLLGAIKETKLVMIAIFSSTISARY